MGHFLRTNLQVLVHVLGPLVLDNITAEMFGQCYASRGNVLVRGGHVRGCTSNVHNAQWIIYKVNKTTLTRRLLHDII